MSSRPPRARAAFAILAILAGACGPDRAITDEPGGAPQEPDAVDAPVPADPDAPALPVAAPEEFDLPGTVPMAGALIAGDDGCWRLQSAWDGALLVLPAGTEQGGSDDELRTAEGAILTGGQAVDATGALVAVESLPGGAAGPWATYVERCTPDTQAIVVAQTLRSIEPPIPAADEAALTDRIVSATLDTHWPCGYGFAVSDATQGVGLFVVPQTPQPPAPGTVTLPDDRFEVEVVVGRHLFVNHCDDVLEWFEPESERFVTWPVTAGRFDYTPGEDTGLCTGSGPVTTQLLDAVVTTPGGSIELPTIPLVNDAFGCFAG
jgi:hypothetical protein